MMALRCRRRRAPLGVRRVVATPASPRPARPARPAKTMATRAARGRMLRQCARWRFGFYFCRWHAANQIRHLDRSGLRESRRGWARPVQAVAGRSSPIQDLGGGGGPKEPKRAEGKHWLSRPAKAPGGPTASCPVRRRAALALLTMDFMMLRVGCCCVGGGLPVVCVLGNDAFAFIPSALVSQRASLYATGGRRGARLLGGTADRN